MNRLRNVIIGFLLGGICLVIYIGTDIYGTLPLVSKDSKEHGVSEVDESKNLNNASSNTITEDSKTNSNADLNKVDIGKAEINNAEINITEIDKAEINKAEISKDELNPEDSAPLGESLEVISQEESQMFYFEEISQEIKDRITGKSYGNNCKVPYEDLRYVKVLYYGFDRETHSGELIVNKAIAQDIVDIFKELYEAKYPIERMVLVDEYDADDNTSMAANNSSAFNYRVIDGTNRISQHSYGLAIDINPLYNPYVREMEGETIVTPVNGAQYADRSLDCQYYIKKDDICYQAFISRGFTWGGDWKSQKDYQHFQKKLD